MIFTNFIPERVHMEPLNNELLKFVKEKRKLANLTQPELAAKAGVGLRFIRELEQGKSTLRMDKVNQVLQLFGHELGPVPFNRQKYLDRIEKS